MAKMFTTRKGGREVVAVHPRALAHRRELSAGGKEIYVG